MTAEPGVLTLQTLNLAIVRGPESVSPISQICLKVQLNALLASPICEDAALTEVPPLK